MNETNEQLPPSNQKINGWLASCLVLVCVIGLPVVFCTGMTSGLVANQNQNVVAVREVRTATGEKVELEEGRRMTASERMVAAQLGVDEAYALGAGRLVTVTGDAAVEYETVDGRLQPKAPPAK